MSDVPLLSKISGLSFDSPVLSPVLFFCLVALSVFHFSVNGPFSLFPQNILQYLEILNSFC